MNPEDETRDTNFFNWQNPIQLLMALLAIPQWSFGRVRTLTRAFRDNLESLKLTVHYCASHVDQNRTWVAFSGPEIKVREGMLRLCEIGFPAIDLNRHAGTYPRIGGLDCCPIIPLLDKRTGPNLKDLRPFVEELAEEIATTYEVPIYLTDKSDRGISETKLSELRQGGFGGLLERSLQPDFGPKHLHPRLGIAAMGLADFQLFFNVSLQPEALHVAEHIAERIHALRAEGDERLLGVRAIAIASPSEESVQICLAATLPDITPLDPIVEFISERAQLANATVSKTELIGAIRQKDVKLASQLDIKPKQIVEKGIE